MPAQELLNEYRQTRDRHAEATRDLSDLLVRMALARLADVFGEPVVIEALGEFNEDWIPRLRVHRVVDWTDNVLFDRATGHPDRVVEDAVDEVDIEYLDVLIDITGDEYMRSVTIG